MTREEFERLVSKIIETNELLAVAQANITDANAEILSMFNRGQDEEDPTPTIQ